MPHTAPDQTITTLRERRDAARDAALAMAQGDDFDPEADSYRGLVAEASSLDAQLEQLVGIVEARSAAAQVDARILNLGPHGTPTASGQVLGEPMIYRPDGDRSFFADMFRARQGNTEAREMLDRHMRSLSSATAAGGGGNVIPPQYLASLFAPDPKFGSPVAASFPQYQLANAASFKLPRQTGSGVVAAQSAENSPPTATDPTFDQITVDPVTLTGRNVMSRQLLDGSNPAIDQIVAVDLRGELLEAIDAAATTALGAASTPATQTGPPKKLLEKIVRMIPAIYGARKAPADSIYMSASAYGYLAAAQDTDGRPLVNAYAPSNAYGDGVTGSLTMYIAGLPVILAPAKVEAAAGPFTVSVAKRSDFAQFLSRLLEFRYEEKSGPQSIEVGVWQYAASVCNRYPSGVASVTHTDGP